ncbi:MAG: exopolysaccharide biosynthesis protein, partial [Sphingomonadales bacterium]|nr:exopolysaccharide biosynthesis protein [Sphingomonadales bacterium]
MNDATPPRLTGSLVERAARLWDLAPPPLPYAAPSAAAPVADPPAPFGPVTAPPAPPVARARRSRHPVATIDRPSLRQQGLMVPGTAVTALAEEFRLVKRNLLTTARDIADA